ncbi:hypothetical protein [Lysinibacillus xylanilyticus]
MRVANYLHPMGVQTPAERDKFLWMQLRQGAIDNSERIPHVIGGAST